jgi:hypothetical protein
MKQRTTKSLDQKKKSLASKQNMAMELPVVNLTTKSSSRPGNCQTENRTTAQALKHVLEVFDTSRQRARPKKSNQSEKSTLDVEAISTSIISHTLARNSDLEVIPTDDDIAIVPQESVPSQKKVAGQDQKVQNQTKPRSNSQALKSVTHANQPSPAIPKNSTRQISALDLNTIINRLDEASHSGIPKDDVIKRLATELDKKPLHIRNWIDRILQYSQSIIDQLKSIAAIDPQKAKIVRPLIRKVKDQHTIYLASLNRRSSSPNITISSTTRLSDANVEDSPEQIQEVIDLEALLLKKRDSLCTPTYSISMTSQTKQNLERKIEKFRRTLLHKVHLQFAATQLALLLKGVQAMTRCSESAMLKILNAFGKERLSFKCLVDWATLPTLGYRVIWRIDC